MHPDLEKLLKLAGEGQGLTDRKREIILRKAKELGEDSAEVEMALENLAGPAVAAATTTPPVSSENKRRKCPNCGATISDYTLTCPECGFVLDTQSNTGVQFQAYVDEFNEQMVAIETKEIFGKLQKKINLINGFTVPVTKEALVLGYNYAKAQHLSAMKTGSPTAAAWYAKCLQFMDMLKSQPHIDEETQRLIDTHNTLFAQKPKNPRTGKQKFFRMLFFVWLAFLLIMLLIAVLVNS